MKEKVSLGSVIKYIFFIITIPLLIMSCIIIYKANKYPDKIPDICGIKPMIVLSGSMETEIYTGDVAFVKNVDTKTLKKEDIIAFRNEDNKVTTHRIVEIIEKEGQTYFRTKGDNNNAEDANLVKDSDVEGLYFARVAGLGKFLMFMQEPVGLAVVLLGVLVVGLLILRMMDKLEDDKNDEKYKKEFEEFKKMKKAEQNKN